MSLNGSACLVPLLAALANLKARELRKNGANRTPVRKLEDKNATENFFKCIKTVIFPEKKISLICVTHIS